MKYCKVTGELCKYVRELKGKIYCEYQANKNGNPTEIEALFLSKAECPLKKED